MAINSLSASSNGLSGLVSGINTQEMVEKMLSGTQAKIDKAGQKKTTLQNKQQMYRDVIAKLKTLQSTYLSFTSGTNLLSSSFYDTMMATVKPPAGTSAAFSVSASSNAQVGNVTMDYIKQLATARTSKTNVPASGGVVANLDQASAKRLVESYQGLDAQLTIRVGDSSVTIQNAPERFAGRSQSDVARILNEEFAGAGIAAEARFTNNKLEIIAANKDDYITVHGNQAAGAKDKTLAMKMFGNVSTLGAKGTFSATIDTDNYMPSFEVNLDGRQQTIRLDLGLLGAFASNGTAQSAQDLAADIQDKLQNAFGAGVAFGVNADGQFEFTSGQPTQKFTITGGVKEMGTLGLKSGISNKLNTSMTLRDLNFGVQLQGDRQTFSIGGVEFSYSSSTSLSTIITDINASKAGVKISYIESEDRFMIQSSETGAGTKEFADTIGQTEGNLMSVLFGAKGGNSASGYGVNIDMVAEGTVSNSDVADGGTFTFNVGGKNHTFTVSRSSSQAKYTAASFATEMNKAFASSFGTMADGTQAVEFLYDSSTKKYTIRSNNPDVVVKATPYDKDKNTKSLGFGADQSTRATSGDVTLGEAGIVFGDNAKISINLGTHGVVEIEADELGADLSMDGLADLINDKIREKMGIPDGDTTTPHPQVSFDKETAAFRVFGIGIPMEIVIAGDEDSENLNNLFGQMSLSLNAEVPLTGGATEYMTETDAGKNAIFSVNGYEQQRASNTFTIDGLTYTLHTTTHKNQQNPDDNDMENPTQITVSRDNDKIVDGVVEFLKLYNETVDFINELYRADATYKDYAPLTEAQKNSMSDREIELWEEKSREGLLRNDSNLERILGAMRKAMYTKPDASSIALYDLGVTTSYYTNDGNLNPTSVDDLRAAIEADPEAVRQLFAGEGGIMELLNDAVNEATRSSYAGGGYITQMAGANALDTSSSIYKQIKEIDDQMVTLESRYWSEYNRYWKQFNSMEQMIQQMNTQSSWLSSYMAG